MTHPLRLGVVGLGSRWRKRYRPALAALPGRFTVVALCDQVFVRARREARRLGCNAATGPAALLERDDLDALFLCDPQWFGLWPLEIACGRKLPILCTLPHFVRDHRVCEVVREVHDCRTPLSVAAALRYTPANCRLQELIAKELGTPRLLLGESIGPSGTVSIETIDWVLAVFDTEPAHVSAHRSADRSFGTLFLEWDDGRAVQLSALRSPAPGRGLHVRLVGVHGDARVHFPGQVEWTAGGTRQTQEFGRRRAAEPLLEAFHAHVAEQGPELPGVAAVERGLRVLQAVQKCGEEGKRVRLGKV